MCGGVSHIKHYKLKQDRTREFVLRLIVLLLNFLIKQIFGKFQEIHCLRVILFMQKVKHSENETQNIKLEDQGNELWVVFSKEV